LPVIFTLPLTGVIAIILSFLGVNFIKKGID